jgi:phosphoglycerol transferase MdoB-like AlkP superfamily enzyme
MTGWWSRFALFVLGMLTLVRAYTVSVHGAVPVWVWLYGLQADVAALIILSAVAALGMRSSRAWVRSSFVILVVAVVLLVVVAEVFYWHEFEARLDRLVFHYLAYPVEVLVFMEEQFYITWLLLPFALLVYLVVRLLGTVPRMERGVPVLLLLVSGVCVLVFVRQPVLDQSRHLNQLSSNGYIGVLTASTISQQDWLELYPGVVSHSIPDDQAQSESSRVPVAKLGNKNVVLIIEESFSGPIWTDPALRHQWLPEFERLSERGLAFNNIYAAGTRTSRGMESIMHGFPPLPGISAIERAGIEHLASLPRVLRAAGYKTIFAYGGWPDFSNFTSYWHRIGFERTTNRNHFPAGTFETSWGAEDKALFSHVIGLMDEMTGQQPVFLATLTVSNHRPFGVPGDQGSPNKRTLMNAMHYADSALGDFFRIARSRPWYENTVFVVVADHGPRIHGDSLIPIESYRVPLLILSEPALPPAKIEAVGSSIGIPATILDLLGVETKEKFWGPSLVSGRDTPVPVEHDYHVGELVAGQLTVLARGGIFYAWKLDEKGVIPMGVIAPSALEARRVADYFGSAHALFYASGSGHAVAEH